MKKILSFLTISLVSLLSAQGANTPSGSIPFELGTASRIYVKGSVNGSRPLRFLFDTGATSMVISTNSLKGVPMAPRGPMKYAEARRTNSPSGDEAWSTFPLLPFPIHRTSGTACWASGSSNGR